jgi:hypothetical protein
MTHGQSAVTEAEWKRFVRSFKAKMDAPTARRALDLLAALSHGANLSIGRRENEIRGYPSVLREPPTEGGAGLSSHPATVRTGLLVGLLSLKIGGPACPQS